MLNIAGRVGCISARAVTRQPKAEKSWIAEKRTLRSFGRRATPSINFRVYEQQRHFRPSIIRSYTQSTNSSGRIETIESFLEEASELATSLASDEVRSAEMISQVAKAQIEVMKKALTKAEAEKSEKSAQIFISLLKTCEMHERPLELIQVAEDFSDLFKKEEVIRSEVRGLYAEALWSLHFSSNSQIASKNMKKAKSTQIHDKPVSFSERAHIEMKKQCDALFTIHSIPAESLVVSLVNLALIEDSSNLLNNAINTLEMAASVCKNPFQFVIPSPTPEEVNDGSEEASAKNSFPEFTTEDLAVVSDKVSAIVFENLGRLLSKSSNETASGGSEEEISKMVSENDDIIVKRAVESLSLVVDCRERMLRTNMNDEELRNAFVAAVETLSEFHLKKNNSSASRLVWERASLVLEYGGDSQGWLTKEIESSRQEVNETKNSKGENAAALHRHAKALLACNTSSSVSDSLAPLTKACHLFREIDDKHSLLDALEDLAIAYETLASHPPPSSSSSSPSSDPLSSAFIDEQIAVFGECLALSGELNGPFHPDNARFLLNLAIFTSARRELPRARDLAKASVYICQKNQMAPSEDVFARAKSVLAMLSSSSAFDAENAESTLSSAKTTLKARAKARASRSGGSSDERM